MSEFSLTKKKYIPLKYKILLSNSNYNIDQAQDLGARAARAWPSTALRDF